MSHALAIANLKARYCAAADSAATDPEGARATLAELFTDDFYGDYGMAQFSGPQAIIDFLCAAIAGNSEWMVHMLTSPQIEVEEILAKGNWAILVWSKRRDTGDVMRVIGRYADEFRLTGDGWKIAKIHFNQFT